MEGAVVHLRDEELSSRATDARAIAILQNEIETGELGEELRRETEASKFFAAYQIALDEEFEEIARGYDRADGLKEERYQLMRRLHSGRVLPQSEQ